MFHNILELIDQDLLKFLRENDALDNFIKNCPNKVGELPEHHLAGIFTIIGCPFTYFNTPEGNEYWLDLSAKFEATLETPTYPDSYFEKQFNEVFNIQGTETGRVYPKKSSLDELI